MSPVESAGVSRGEQMMSRLWGVIETTRSPAAIGTTVSSPKRRSTRPVSVGQRATEAHA
jgi:hypothetical protein